MDSIMRMMALKQKYGVSACVTADAQDHGTVHFYASMVARTDKDGNVMLDGLLVQDRGQLLVKVPPELHGGAISVVLSEEGNLFVNDIATEMK
jgi:hypothetical protein